MCAGHAKSGGYAVEFSDITLDGDAWTVDAKYVSPGPNDMVIWILTYPYNYVRIKDDGNAIKVCDVTRGQAIELAVTQE